MSDHTMTIKKAALIVVLISYLMTTCGCAFLVAGAAAGAYIHGRNIEKEETESK